MTTKREEYKERIEIASIIFKRYEKELKDKFPILREMSDKEAIRLLAKTAIKGVIRRWSE